MTSKQHGVFVGIKDTMDGALVLTEDGARRARSMRRLPVNDRHDFEFLEKVKGSRVQIIAMSATMGGLDKLQLWLNTAIYQCNFRPVPLNEHFMSKGVLRTQEKALLDVGELASI